MSKIPLRLTVLFALFSLLFIACDGAVTVEMQPEMTVPAGAPGTDSTPDTTADAADNAQNPICTDPNAKPHPQAERLAAQFSVDYAEIVAWFCQGYGFGEIKLAYEISAESGTPVADLFAMVEAGQGWGEVMQGVGLKPQADADGGDQNPICTDPNAKPHPQAERIATDYNVPYDEVVAWFCQGYGFGTIKLAYAISIDTGTPVADLFAMFEGGQGWGEIMQALDYKAGQGKGKGCNPHDPDCDKITGSGQGKSQGKGCNPHDPDCDKWADGKPGQGQGPDATDTDTPAPEPTTPEPTTPAP